MSEKGYLPSEAIKEAVSTIQSGHDCFSSLNVELWFKMFIDQDPYWLSQARTKA